MARFTSLITNQYGIQILDAHETYQDFIAEHPTGEPGDAHIVGTHLYSWNAELNEWVDAGEIVGPQGETGERGPIGPAGADGDPLDFLAVPSNIVPDTDNTRSLGTAEKRFSDIHVGPGTVYITDQTLGTDAELTVNNGVLQINGANQLQVGQLRFVDNTIQSIDEDVDIAIGTLGDSGSLLFNRSVVMDDRQTLTVGNLKIADESGNARVFNYGGTGVDIQGSFVKLRDYSGSAQINVAYSDIDIYAQSGPVTTEGGTVTLKSYDNNGSSPGSEVVVTSSGVSLSSDSGTINVLSRFKVTAPVPAHSYGSTGDVAGLVAIDSNYLYYCSTNYVNNSTNIWKRVALTGGTW
jgi:hypothetical protein